MCTTLILLVATWLIVGPALLGFGTTAAVGSALSGIVAALVVLTRRWDHDRYFWVVLLGVYNMVAGFLYGGVARWSAVLAGLVLAVAGTLALKGEEASSSPQKPAEAGAGREA